MKKSIPCYYDHINRDIKKLLKEQGRHVKRYTFDLKEKYHKIFAYAPSKQTWANGEFHGCATIQ